MNSAITAPLDRSIMLLPPVVHRAWSRLHRNSRVLLQQQDLLEEIDHQLEEVLRLLEGLVLPATTTNDDKRNNHYEAPPSKPAQQQQQQQQQEQHLRRITRHQAAAATATQPVMAGPQDIVPGHGRNGGGARRDSDHPTIVANVDAWIAPLHRLLELRGMVAARYSDLVDHDLINANSHDDLDDFSHWVHSIREELPDAGADNVLEIAQQRLAVSVTALDECWRRLQEQMVRLNNLADRLLGMFARHRQLQQPTAPHVLDALPRMAVSGAASHEDNSCGICAEMVEPHAVLLQLPCRHAFHETCLMPWLQAHNTCPYCRHVLPTAGNSL